MNDETSTSEEVHSLLPLGIVIERQTTTSLVVQLASGIQAAIQSGALPVGARLPRVREISEQMGVSYVVASRAVQSLAGSGFLQVRRKTGIFVAPLRDKVWKAHVLWITPTSASYYFASRQEAFVSELSKNDVRVTTLCVEGGRREESIRQAKAAMQTTRFTAVVSTVSLPGVIAECKDLGIPLITSDNGLAPKVAGHLSTTNEDHVRVMAKHCVELGVKKISVLSPHGHLAPVVESTLSEEGLSIEMVKTTDHWGEQGAEGVECLEYVGFEAGKRLAQSGDLPELLYIVDDYAARGCISALLQNGVAVPEEMKLIIQGNRRHLPVIDKPFTRMVVDPEEVGRILAELTLDVLQSKSKKTLKRNVGPQFIVGETT